MAKQGREAPRGYFGIGIFQVQNEVNIGTLWRSAYSMGASYIFTIGKQYKKQVSDTPNAWKHIPLYHYDTFQSFYDNLPHGCQLIGVELDEKSVDLRRFEHPQRCVYLLGAETHGLPENILNKCHKIVQIPGTFCLNVAVAGSIVMYSRCQQNYTLEPCLSNLEMTAL